MSHLTQIINDLESAVTSDSNIEAIDQLRCEVAVQKVTNRHINMEEALIHCYALLIVKTRGHHE